MREKNNPTFPYPEISKMGLFCMRVRSRNTLEAACNHFWVEHCLPFFLRLSIFTTALEMLNENQINTKSHVFYKINGLLYKPL